MGALEELVMRHIWVGVGMFSGAINLLSLAGPLFMLEIYDRVIPSRSTPTMVALLILIAGLYAFSGFLDILRARMLARPQPSICRFQTGCLRRLRVHLY